jgi:hypothetical protein
MEEELKEEIVEETIEEVKKENEEKQEEIEEIAASEEIYGIVGGEEEETKSEIN